MQNSTAMSSSPSLCVLFADVAGSNQLYEKLGAAEASHAVERCIKRMERAVAVHRGRIVKILGDELMAVFGDVESAVDSACEIQERIDSLPPVSGIKLAIRAGLHYGPVTEQNDEVFGDTVNVAARIIGLAAAGQILVTTTTVEELPNVLQEAARKFAEQTVKSKSGDLSLSELIWRDTGELRTRAHLQSTNVGSAAPLRLRHAGITLQVEAEKERLSFGRDASCDLIVADRRASRYHARIEKRDGEYVLVDQSTNGTYVTFDGELEFALKNEEIPLRGRGRIAFGHSARDPNAEIVEFEVSF